MAILPILGAALRIPRSLLSESEVDQIRGELTISPTINGKLFGGEDVPKQLIMYDIDGDWLVVPRAYGLSVMRQFSVLRGSQFVDNLSNGTPVQMDFNESLQSQRPEMKRVQDRLVNSVAQKFRNGILNGILCAPCGTGKTVMGCKLASMMGRTTLILAHKEFLVDQWRDRIEQWMGVPRDEVGIIQQNRCEFDGRRIAVAMLQSIVEREYDPRLYSWAGLVLVDEVHRHGADLWHKAVMRFSSRYRLGLTATPARKDGMWPVIRANFGEILASDSGEAMKPTIYVVRYHPGYDVRQYAWVRPVGFGEYRIKKVYLAKLLNLMATDPSRNRMIAEIILKSIREGRKSLLLSDRLNHLDHLKDLIHAQNPNAKVGRYVGGMTSEARSVSEGCQVILGTFQMAQEALDIPSLDVGFLATPHSDVEQATGRICRLMDGKKQPVIVDIADDEPHLCEPFLRKRLQLYGRRDWQVKFIT